MVNIFGNGEAKAELVAFSESAPSGDKFALRDFVGEVLTIKVDGPKRVSTSFGEKTAIQCHVKHKGTTYADVLIFNSAPVSQLEPYAGSSVVVKVEQYKSNAGTMAPRFVAPSDEELKAAESI